jgi:large subunit ribosomal protein L18
MFDQNKVKQWALNNIMTKIKRLVRRKDRRKNRSKKTSKMHPSRFRLVIFRSLKHFEAQVINDFKGETLVSISSKEKKIKSAAKKSSKTDICTIIGKELAKRIKTAKLGPVVLDRNGYPYHGRVKAFTESARINGLEL